MIARILEFFSQSKETKTEQPGPGQDGSSKSQWIRIEEEWVKVDHSPLASQPSAVQPSSTSMVSIVLTKSSSTNEITTLSSGAASTSGAFSFKLSDEKLSDDVNVGSDALSDYFESLKKTRAAFEGSLDQYKSKKINIIGDNKTLLQYASDKKAHAGQSVLGKLNSFFASLFGMIKKTIEPACYELEGLLQETHDAVEELCNKLESASKDLNDLKDPSRSADGCRIMVDMCNISIEINNDLIVMIDNIESELSSCLKSEKLTEQAVKQLINLLILVVIKIPMIELNFEFTETYRNFLNNEIKEEKIKIEKFETDVMGLLRNAMKEIEQKQVEWIDAKKEVNQSELKSGADTKLILLPANSSREADVSSAPSIEPVMVKGM